MGLETATSSWIGEISGRFLFRMRIGFPLLCAGDECLGMLWPIMQYRGVKIRPVRPYQGKSDSDQDQVVQLHQYLAPRVLRKRVLHSAHS
jgi:hypothetical protein